MYSLKPKIQNYAWGKIGLNSTVAQLIEATGEKIDNELPYAELWMGTHPNGPSQVSKDGKTWIDLKDFLKDGKLPFLFKVLSVNKALSIQAHPNKALAEMLHAEQPKIYRDPNHKPEMAIALTDFEALVGFKRCKEIFDNIANIPELKDVLSEAIASEEYESIPEDSNKTRLEYLFTSLMKVTSFKSQLKTLESRLKSQKENLCLEDGLILRLFKEYPGDIGIFCVFFLNYRILKKGEAVFLGANEPHAYLNGDCVEIMANSDNVIRAGLTPKLRDVETLCSMLTYQEFNEKTSFLSGVQRKENVKNYSPPDEKVDEFEIQSVSLKAGIKNFKLDLCSYESIILALEGECTFELAGNSSVINSKRGSIFFNERNTQIIVNAHSDCSILRASVKGSFS